eukprot:GEMP01119487.1.p1 GENE.GEMP01119487.1~~GEMP01119487.1.p1  ORF type:complete len:102 (+),score=11.90 GEMP01119487.1:181-486(+)
MVDPMIKFHREIVVLSDEGRLIAEDLRKNLSGKNHVQLSQAESRPRGRCTALHCVFHEELCRLSRKALMGPWIESTLRCHFLPPSHRRLVAETSANRAMSF